jgi:hypothetical protein
MEELDFFFLDTYLPVSYISFLLGEGIRDAGFMLDWSFDAPPLSLFVGGIVWGIWCTWKCKNGWIWMDVWESTDDEEYMMVAPHPFPSLLFCGVLFPVCASAKSSSLESVRQLSFSSKTSVNSQPFDCSIPYK